MMFSQIQTRRNPSPLDKYSSKLSLRSILHVRRSLQSDDSLPEKQMSIIPMKVQAPLKRKLTLKQRVQKLVKGRDQEKKKDDTLSSDQQEMVIPARPRKQSSSFLPFLNQRDALGRLIGSQYQKNLRDNRKQRKMKKASSLVIDIQDVAKHIKRVTHRNQSVDIGANPLETYDGHQSQRESTLPSEYGPPSSRLPQIVPGYWRKNDVFFGNDKKSPSKNELSTLYKNAEWPLKQRLKELQEKITVPRHQFTQGTLRSPSQFMLHPEAGRYNPSHAHRAKASPTLEFNKMQGREAPKLRYQRKQQQIQESPKTANFLMQSQTSPAKQPRRGKYAQFQNSLARHLRVQSQILKESFEQKEENEEVTGIFKANMKNLKPFDPEAKLFSMMVRRLQQKHKRTASVTDLEDVD